ncbi:hypothetical protein ABH966_003055 [Lysinibacillus sp. RC46]|uniref:hypothetical protein n=1 Tax=Lysinibacillus sp. RC46 TaxID=3156295 RepID=UPI00351371E2
MNGIIYAARGDKVSTTLFFGAMIPVVGNAAKGISEGVQNANKGLGSMTEKVNKQVENVVKKLS